MASKHDIFDALVVSAMSDAGLRPAHDALLSSDGYVRVFTGSCDHGRRYAVGVAATAPELMTADLEQLARVRTNSALRTANDACGAHKESI